MYKHVRNYIIRLAVCGLVLFAFSQCSPQKRLNRLIANNPELAKTDTVYTTRDVIIPGFSLDTTFKASEDVSGLSEIIDTYKQYIDSVNRIKLTSEVKNYILTRPCLEDTFRFSLKNNGWAKVWQKKEQFYFSVSEPAQKYSYTVPVSLQKFDVTARYNWQMFWAGAFCCMFVMALVNMILRYFKK